MEEQETKTLDFGAEQGALIPVSVMVVFALIVATLAVGAPDAGRQEKWRPPIPCQFEGVTFWLNLPRGVHLGEGLVSDLDRIDKNPSLEWNAASKYGWIDRGTLKFKIYRDNVRLGFLDIDVPGPRRRLHHPSTWESIEIGKGNGAIVFRFRHLAGDGEAGTLMKKTAESIVVLTDRGASD